MQQQQHQQQQQQCGLQLQRSKSSFDHLPFATDTFRGNSPPYSSVVDNKVPCSHAKLWSWIYCCLRCI